MTPQSSFYAPEELREVGLVNIGRNVLISRKTSIYGAEAMEFGDNVRIDDFCVLSGRIKLGSYVHIAAYSGLFGGAGIEMMDFAGLSSRVSIYSSSDDYSGTALTNPTVPEEFKSVVRAPVVLGRHVIVGAGAVILPGVSVGEGSAVGALALVTRSLDPWGVYSGAPARRISARKQDLLRVEAEFLASRG